MNLKTKTAVFTFLCVVLVPVVCVAQPSQFDSGAVPLGDLVSGLRNASAAQPAPAPEAAPPAAQPPAGNNEYLHFWEELKADVFEDICGDVELENTEALDLAGTGALKGKIKRYLKQFPDNKVAVIDEVGVRLEGGKGSGELLNIGGSAFNVSFSGTLEGKSVVVRKTGEARYCKELLNLLDLRKAKTILPVNEKRIAAMGVGEIWKFPMLLRMSLGGGLGHPTPPWFSVSFTFGKITEQKPSVTLYKMDENRLRLRIRLDKVTVSGGGVSAGTSLDAGLIGLPEAENILAKEIDRAYVRELNRYIALRFGLSSYRSRGGKILLEFLIDPRDGRQLAGLVEFLKGDLGVIRRLIQMGVRFSDYSDADDNAAGQQALQNVNEVAQQGLGLASSFAGANHFNGTSHGSNLTLPVLLQQETGTAQRYDRYQTTDGKEVLHVHTASKNTSVSNINVPFVGKIFKHNASRNFYVVNQEGADGVLSNAALAYQRYEGYVKHDELAARAVVEEMNGVLKLAGAHGGAANGSFGVDLARLFPAAAPEAGQRRYNSAIMSFSLFFTEKAVADIIASPALAIMEASLNLLEGLDREIIGKVRHLLRIGGEGKVVYDWKAGEALIREYRRSGDDPFDPFSVVSAFCSNVSFIISDLAAVRAEPDQKTRSARLAALLGGKGRGRAGYESILRVLIQFVDVKDIYAALALQTDKRLAGEADIAASYQFYNTGLQGGYDSQFQAVNALRDRFSDPSTLSD